MKRSVGTTVIATSAGGPSVPPLPLGPPGVGEEEGQPRGAAQGAWAASGSPAGKGVTLQDKEEPRRRAQSTKSQGGSENSLHGGGIPTFTASRPDWAPAPWRKHGNCPHSWTVSPELPIWRKHSHCLSLNPRTPLAGSRRGCSLGKAAPPQPGPRMRPLRRLAGLSTGVDGLGCPGGQARTTTWGLSCPCRFSITAGLAAAQGAPKVEHSQTRALWAKHQPEGYGRQRYKCRSHFINNRLRVA